MTDMGGDAACWAHLVDDEDVSDGRGLVRAVLESIVGQRLQPFAQRSRELQHRRIALAVIGVQTAQEHVPQSDVVVINPTELAIALRPYEEDIQGILVDVVDAARRWHESAELHGLSRLVARIPGTGGGKRLLLVGHTDTVLADPSEWSVDPWSGELRDGCVWGRGALDMKSQVAAEVAAASDVTR